MQVTTAYPSSSRIPFPVVGLRPNSVRKASSEEWWIDEQEPGKFRVGSVGSNAYDVVFHPEDRSWSCSCPDFQYRRKPCKHIIAVWLHGPVTTVSEGGKVFIVPQSLNTNNSNLQQGESAMYTNTPQSSQARLASGQARPTPTAPAIQARPASVSSSQAPVRPAQTAQAPVRPAQTVQAQAPARPAQTAQAQAPARPAQTAQAQVRPAQAQPAWMRNYDRGDDIGETYPYIQWANRGSDLEPSQPIGGFAAPLDQNVPLPNSIYAILHHLDGGSTEVMYTDQLEVMVLRRRFYWYDPNTKVRLPAYQKGARGKTQFLCYIKTEDGVFGPVKLTFTGMAGVYFDTARHEFARAVRRATGGKAPAYAFWMTVVAGQTVMVGKGDRRSPITPPTWSGDFDPDRDFVGAELLDAINWGEVDRWASLKRELVPETNGVEADEEYEEYEEYYEEPDEDIPF